MSSLLSYVFASPFCRISCHFISCFLRMQSRNTAELRDVFSSLLRVFDMAAACAGILFFCARQKRLRQVPVPERCAAAALLFFLILQILSFSTEAESSQPPMRRQKIRNRLGGNNTGKTGKSLKRRKLQWQKSRPDVLLKESLLLPRFRSPGKYRSMRVRYQQTAYQ